MHELRRAARHAARCRRRGGGVRAAARRPTSRRARASGATASPTRSTRRAPACGSVTPDYFRTVKIPLRAGRLFDAHDDESVARGRRRSTRKRRGDSGRARIRSGSRSSSASVSSAASAAVRRRSSASSATSSGTASMLCPRPRSTCPTPSIRWTRLTIVVRTTGDPAAFVAGGARRSRVARSRVADRRRADDGRGHRPARSPERRFTMLLLAVVCGSRAGCSPRSVSTASSRIWSASGRRRSASASRIGAAPEDVVRAVSCGRARCSTLVGVAAGLGRRAARRRALVDAAVRRHDDRPADLRRRRWRARDSPRWRPATCRRRRAARRTIRCWRSGPIRAFFV